MRRSGGARFPEPAQRDEAASSAAASGRADEAAARPDPARREEAPAVAADRVTIHSDGACKGNPGPGGWGALLAWGAHERELCGGDAHTTNNRMELTAVIRALESLKRACEVDLYTDSQYVKNGIETWIHGWKRNGWRTADKKPVKNAELWRELDVLAAQHRIRWHWVKGHNADPGNERADALANRGVEMARGR